MYLLASKLLHFLGLLVKFAQSLHQQLFDLEFLFPGLEDHLLSYLPEAKNFLLPLKVVLVIVAVLSMRVRLLSLRFLVALLIIQEIVALLIRWLLRLNSLGSLLNHGEEP